MRRACNGGEYVPLRSIIRFPHPRGIPPQYGLIMRASSAGYEVLLLEGERTHLPYFSSADEVASLFTPIAKEYWKKHELSKNGKELSETNQRYYERVALRFLNKALQDVSDHCSPPSGGHLVRLRNRSKGYEARLAANS
ncbi:hypothetical protein GOV07_03550 [Candidatus Woesearchaeota archaeon]|nr:hypothetical protein [Candidatus Woesearchaeota archaeon]